MTKPVDIRCQLPGNDTVGHFKIQNDLVLTSVSHLVILFHMATGSTNLDTESAKGEATGTLARLADRLKDDIRRRGLASGDKYLSTREAGDLLGVSVATASRAMQLLAEHQMLVRRNRSGTFVGPKFGGKKKVKVRTVFILLPEEMQRLVSLDFDTMIKVIRQSLDGPNVQVSFVPERDQVAYVRELVDGANSLGQLAGVIPISCSRDIYRYLDEAGIPTVVLGSLYPDQQHLPSVDLDYRQSGELLATYVTSRCHKRIALLNTGEHRPGDDHLIDGISHGLSAANLPHNTLITRTVPHDPHAIPAMVRHIFEMENRPTAIIARSIPILRAIEEAAKELGLSVPDDVEIILECHATNDSDRESYPHVQSSVSFKVIVEHLGDLLKQAIDGSGQAVDPVVIPMELCESGRAESSAS